MGFANVYLNELDQFVKHQLKAQNYIRYVDDFVILHHSIHELQKYKIQIEQFLDNNLNLTLHPEKSRILPLKQGITFLGLRIFYHHKLLRIKNIRKFERSMREMQELYARNEIQRENVIEKVEGWLAYACHANTYKYRQRLLQSLPSGFPVTKELCIKQPTKHTNFEAKIEGSSMAFSVQKTLLLFKQGKTISEIAAERGIKEGTVWDHIASLIEYHKIKLKELLPKGKVRMILKGIHSPIDTLAEIKQRLHNNSISFHEINCVLATVKGKQNKKSIAFYTQWYRTTNCFRKCFFHKDQRVLCKSKLLELAIRHPTLTFTKNEYLDFINNKTTICVLPDQEKKRFISYQEFRMRTKQNLLHSSKTDKNKS